MTALSTDPGVRQAYSSDASGLVMVPDAVARPESAEEIREVLQQASAERTPVTTAGGQTSTTASSIADRGILLSTRKMTHIIDVDPATRTAVVEPGVLLGDLQKVLAAEGLLFPPDPTSENDVTLGGAIACNASGARTLSYGPTRAHVRALQVALPNGELLEFRRAGLDKNTAGYHFAHDPVDWFIGSEGTLGIITRAEIALVPKPENVIGLGIPCADERVALERIVRIRESREVAPLCVEYFDEIAHGIARPGATGALIYVEEVADEPSEFWMQFDDVLVFEGTKALAEARRIRHAVPATMNERGASMRPAGGRKVSTDWAVPFRLLAPAIATARRLADDAGIPQPAIYGHAGNGHPHENFIAKDADELRVTEQVVEATLQHVLSVGGTVSAEHGIGKIKRKWLPLQASPAQLAVMRAVKRELDPLGILAPGNIL